MQDLLRLEAQDQTLATASVLRKAPSAAVVPLAEAVPLLVLLLLLRQAPSPRVFHNRGDAVDPLQSLHDRAVQKQQGGVSKCFAGLRYLTDCQFNGNWRDSISADWWRSLSKSALLTQFRSAPFDFEVCAAQFET